MVVISEFVKNLDKNIDDWDKCMRIGPMEAGFMLSTNYKLKVDKERFLGNKKRPIISSLSQKLL